MSSECDILGEIARFRVYGLGYGESKLEIAPLFKFQNQDLGSFPVQDLGVSKNRRP